MEYTGQSLQNKRLIVAYARVSNNSQKDDLKNQISFIRQYVNAKGVILDDTITDIGSGLNYNRKNWNKLLEKVMQNEIDTIYITYKDRFVRFGYEWFERLCKMHDTKIVVLNNVETSPNQEMIDDMVSIVHVFSGRLSGLRKYQTKIQNDKSLKGGEKDDPNAKGQAVSEQNDAKGD